MNTSLAITTIVCIAILAIAIITVRVCKNVGNHAIDVGKDLGTNVLATVERISTNFFTGNITHHFRESCAQVSSTKGDILELAVNQCDAMFATSDERTVVGVYLGTTTAEIRVPAT